MNSQVLQDVLSSTRLPTPPAIAMRIIEMTNDPKVTPLQLTNLIQADSALSSKILKTVNSAFYGLSTPVASIQRAQIMLGLSAIKSLTLGFSLVESLGGDDDSGFDYRAFWSRSLHAAACAKSIAARAGCMEPEEALLGGLLQDVGMVVLHRVIGPAYCEAIKDAEGRHRKITGIELSQFDITHPTVAATLAERWRFPATLITTLRYHEQVTAAPKAHQDAVRCVGLASLGASVLTEPNPESVLRTYLSKAGSWLKLDHHDAEAALEEAGEGARQIAKLIEVPAGAPVNAHEILESAKAKLVDVSISGHIEDAVARARQEKGIDSETGLASKDSFVSMLEDAYQRTIDAEGTLTVATLDVHVPLSAGGGGEAAAPALGELLERAFDTYGGEVGRTGPHAFAVLLPGVDARTAAQACKALVEAGVEVGDDRFVVRAGFTTLDQENASCYLASGALLTAAEQALDAARTVEEGAVRAFVPQTRSAA